MSTPFPMEEAQEESSSEPRYNPWDAPSSPGFFAGSLSAVPEGLAEGGAAFIDTVNTNAQRLYGGLGDIADAAGVPSTPFRYLEQGMQQAVDTSHELVRRNSVDSSTMGTAAQILHNVAKGGYEMSTGALLGGAPGAAALTGGIEGSESYQQSKDAGIDTNTALGRAAVSAITSAAGTMLPGGVGESLAARVFSGAAINTAFGAAGRFADSKILDDGGYHEMADQQKVLDTTQLLTDAALGATFGLIHHALSPPEQAALKRLQDPQNRDAAMTANLSLRDRAAAPGVPTDPRSAALHDDAMEKAQTDLAQSKQVDVSATAVDEAYFLARPERDLTETNKIILSALKESGLFEEETSLKNMQDQLEAMRNPPEPEDTRVPMEKPEPGEEPRPVPIQDPLTQALTERPDLQIVRPDGTAVGAQGALDRATEKAATVADEAPKAMEAAANCFGRSL